MVIATLHMRVNGKSMFMNYITEPVTSSQDMYLLKKDIVDILAKSKQVAVDKITIIALHDIGTLSAYSQFYVTVFITTKNGPVIKDMTVTQIPQDREQLAGFKIMVAEQIKKDGGLPVGDVILLGIIPLTSALNTNVVGLTEMAVA